VRRTLALALAVPLALAVLGGEAAAPDPSASSTIADAPTLPSPHERGPVPESEMATSSTGSATEPAMGAAMEQEPDVAPADAEGTIGGTDRVQADDTAPQRGDPGPGAERDGGPIEASFLVASAPEQGATAGTGRRWRYTIEVEPGLGIDPERLAIEVRAALHDDRSWARIRTLEQVNDPSQARIRVVLASPDTVDELCGRAGLRTAGIYSCWNGRFAALNSWRWQVGADGFDDITTYRTYLVNHEFGHGLGYGHVGCPAAGALAPVMMQQSKGHDGCVANGWPYP
jgi:hypothetical protein